MADYTVLEIEKLIIIIKQVFFMYIIQTVLI